MSIRLSANGGTPIAYQSVSIQVEGNDADDANETAKEKEPAGLLPRNWEPHRIISRSSGRPTISRTGVKTGYFRYAKDNFTTLINFPWWLIILMFCTIYILSWFFFGVFWFVIAYADGGFNNTCIGGVTDFSSAFLLSIETQVTIGYGNLHVVQGCSWGIFVLVFQCLIGLIIDSVLLGLIFAKLARPVNRRQTIIFSKQAVIYEENGEPYLEVRIADLRQSQMVEAHVRIHLYWYELVDPFNNKYEFRQQDLECGYDGGTDRVILIMPIGVRHRIRPWNPLYKISQAQLDSLDLEVVVILEGIVEPTGLTAQALWSYTTKEILLNRKFAPIVSRNKGKWNVKYSQIDCTEPCPPLDTEQLQDEEAGHSL